MALGPANRVVVVNGEAYEVEEYLLVSQRVWQLAFTPDEKLLFTTDGVSNDVSVIAVEALKVTKSIGVGRFPWGMVAAAEQLDSCGVRSGRHTPRRPSRSEHCRRPCRIGHYLES